MEKILYVKASPREERSHSVAVAETFLKTYKTHHPNVEVMTIDLFKILLPSFNKETINARYSLGSGETLTAEQLKAWQPIEQLIAQFKAADKYVFAVPMWNFGIPYLLKQYFDVIIQPSYTFSYSPDKGYEGLVTGKPAFLSVARGGTYPAGTPYEAYDMQKKYLETALGFIGFTDIKTVVVEPTLAKGPTGAKEAREDAKLRAQELATGF